MGEIVCVNGNELINTSPFAQKLKSKVEAKKTEFIEKYQKGAGIDFQVEIPSEGTFERSPIGGSPKAETRGVYETATATADAPNGSPTGGAEVYNRTASEVG